MEQLTVIISVLKAFSRIYSLSLDHFQRVIILAKKPVNPPDKSPIPRPTAFRKREKSSTTLYNYGKINREK